VSEQDDATRLPRPQQARRTEVLRLLRDLARSEEPEIAHAEADDLLLRLINDPEIVAAFDAVPKWYA
jgi:hypothetical protein